MNFGYTLKTMRKAAGISLRGLAKQIGVSAAYISQVERGSLPPPTFKRLQDIASVLHVPVSSLVNLTDRVSPALIDYINSIPEITNFLLTAQKYALKNDDFQLLTNTLSMIGKTTLHNHLLKIHNGQPTRLREASERFSLRTYINEHLVWLKLSINSQESLFQRLSEGIGKVHEAVDPHITCKALTNREKQGSTGIGNGIALPHACVDTLSSEVMAVATLEDGLHFDAIDKQPVYLVFLFIGHQSTRHTRLKLLARVAQLASTPGFTDKLRRSPSKPAFINQLIELDNRVH